MSKVVVVRAVQSAPATKARAKSFVRRGAVRFTAGEAWATLRLFVFIIARQPVHLSARQRPPLPCACLFARPGEKRNSESLAAAHHLRTVARGSEVFGEPDRLQIRQAITRRRLRVT